MSQLEQTTYLGSMNLKQFEHPTIRDKDGLPMIEMSKLRDYLAVLALEVVKESASRLGLMADECRASAKMLDEENVAIGHHLERAKEVRKELIETHRSMRSIAVTEVAATIKPLEDVRKFFLCDAHTKEVERLKEFVELCERLQKLKESGFLDSVADTILKLS